jgi:flagellar export protein FliJ
VTPKLFKEMKRFKFQFAAVLKIRKTREEESLRVLAQTQRQHQQELQRKSKLVSELNDALIRRESLGIEAIGIDAFQLEESFIVGTKQRIVQQDQALVRASRNVEKALRVYLTARRQTRAIEILREKQFLEFKKSLAKQEQKDLDDLSVMRARLRNVEEETA